MMLGTIGSLEARPSRNWEHSLAQDKGITRDRDSEPSTGPADQLDLWASLQTEAHNARFRGRLLPIGMYLPLPREEASAHKNVSSFDGVSNVCIRGNCRQALVTSGADAIERQEGEVSCRSAFGPVHAKLRIALVRLAASAARAWRAHDRAAPCRSGPTLREQSAPRERAALSGRD